MVWWCVEMKNKVNKIKGQQSQQKGVEYEKFVAEVYNYWNSLLKGKEWYRIEKNKDKNSGEIDIYFEYKLPNGVNKTCIECKSGKITKEGIYAFHTKLQEKGGNIHGIICYQDDKQISKGIQSFCKTHNIELKKIIKDSGFESLAFYAYRQFLLTFKVVKRDDGNSLDLQLPVELIPFGKDNNDNLIFVSYDGKAIEEYIDKDKSSLITDEKDYKFFKPITDKFLFDKLKPEFQEGIFPSKEMKTNFKLFELQTEKDDVKKFLLICEYVSILRDDGNMSFKIKTEDKTEQFCYIRKPLEN